MNTTHALDRFTTLPDEETLAATAVALEEHGFSVEIVDNLDAARVAVLARIPDGSSVMTNTSVTLQETGIADTVDAGDPYDSARTKMMALDFATQLQEMKAIAGQPDFALGSVHAVTRDGALFIASASGSQLASYAWGAANVIFVDRRAEARPHRRGRTRTDLRVQPPTRGRPRVRRLWAEQLRRQDPRDPPGVARADPRRARPTGGWVLIAGGSILMATPEPGVGGTASADPSDAFDHALDRRHARRVPNVPLFVRPDIDRVALADQA